MGSLISFSPIGVVESCYPDKFGTPRQSGLVREARASIRINSEFQPEEALQGLEGFSFLWVVFLFHQNKSARFHAKVHPPRLGGQAMGVFATRSPHRPNPIGLSLVEIIQIEKDSILVAGVDFIEGTPVLDIKPYLPEIEAKPQARRGWTDIVEPDLIEIEWSKENLEHLKKWEEKSGHINLLSLIEGTLRLDPRPLIYKGFEEGESPYRTEHAVRFYDGDIHFKFVTSKKIQILKVKYPGDGLC